MLLGGDVCDRYGDYKADSHIDEIINAWGKVGVSVREVYVYSEMYGGDVCAGYQFFVGDKKCKKREAYEHAMKVVGKHLEPKDWCW